MFIDKKSRKAELEKLNLLVTRLEKATANLSKVLNDANQSAKELSKAVDKAQLAKRPR